MTRVLTTSGKLFLRDAGATANEPSPALVWARFTSVIARRMQYSCRVHVNTMARRCALLCK